MSLIDVNVFLAGGLLVGKKNMKLNLAILAMNILTSCLLTTYVNLGTPMVSDEVKNTSNAFLIHIQIM